MGLTRSAFEAVLVRATRGGLKLTGISPDPDTDTPPRTYLDDAIGYGVRGSGGTTANFSGITDSDLATVAPAKWDQMRDLAELRVLENILGNWMSPNQTRDGLNQALGDLGKLYVERVKDLRMKAQEVYGVDAQVPMVSSSATGGFSGQGGVLSSI